MVKTFSIIFDIILFMVLYEPIASHLPRETFVRESKSFNSVFYNLTRLEKVAFCTWLLVFLSYWFFCINRIICGALKSNARGHWVGYIGEGYEGSLEMHNKKKLFNWGNRNVRSEPPDGGSVQNCGKISDCNLFMFDEECAFLRQVLCQKSIN